MLLQEKLDGQYSLYSCYADEHEQEAAYERLVNDHVAPGNPRPSHRIFLRDVSDSRTPSEKRFLCAF